MSSFGVPRLSQRTADAQATLRRLTVRGAGATVLSQTLAFCVQMVATIVLARLLIPRDFGLVTMVTTASLLLLNCGLNGFTEAVLQWDVLDPSITSNLFWINVGVGSLLTIAFAGAGSLLARFYAEPLVTRVAAIMSLTILINSFSVIHIALLKRAMRFTVVAINDVIARSVSVVFSIILALYGWHYWALVCGAIALPLSTTIGAWIAYPWLPMLPRRHTATVPMLRFAMSTYARFISNYGSNNLDNLLVGWRFGSGALGFYKKAYDLFVLPANQLSAPLTGVAVSALSRLNRDPLQYRRYFFTALSILAFVGMAMGANLTLVGRDLIRLLLGPQWGEAGRVFTFFGPGIGIMLLYGTHGWIHLSIGRADRWFRWSLLEIAVTASLFVVGLHWGPVGIALAWVASFWLLTLPALWYAGKPAGILITEVVRTVWKYILASALAACACTLIVRAIAPLAPASNAISTMIRILITSLVFGSLYVGAVICLHRGCTPLHQVAGLFRDLLPLTNLSRSSPSLVTGTVARAQALCSLRPEGSN